MARSLRIEYPGALYHVTSRGNGNQAIYYDEKDRLWFLESLKESIERYGVVIHAYALMDNHFHLIIETPRGNLSKSMQTINTAYTVYFNRQHNRIGHLYQGRYKAILVDKDSYLLQLSRYIHLNPVRANIVQRPEDYPWSSYREYLGFQPKISLVKIEDTLAQFGEDIGTSLKRYRSFVEEGLKKEITNPLNELVANLILGSEDFIQRVRDKVGEIKENRSIPSTRILGNGLKIEEIEKKVCTYFGISEDEVKRRRKGNMARGLCIFFAYQLTGLTNKEIGEYFGKISESAVTETVRRVERRGGWDTLFRKEMEEIKKILINE